MPDVAAPATTAPPVDPVRAALADPEVGARLLALARSVLRRPGVDHEDLVQTAVRRALANSHQFDPDAGSVSAWLTGKWPTALAGPIAGVEGETWGAVANALQKGRRGLPAGERTLSQLVQECRTRSTPADPQPTKGS